MKTYEERKEEARESAINWQHETAEKKQSYFELMQAGAHFEKLAKRWGLVKEFRENGII